PEGFHGAPLDVATERALVACATYAHLTQLLRDASISGQQAGYRAAIGTDWVAFVGREEVTVALEDEGDGVRIVVDGQALAVECDWQPGSRRMQAVVDGR
ncbi:hypothetical protein AB0038_27530, partial [Klebsiella pneumoniae]